jgi:prepilin peptidase CpaA
VVLNPWVLVFLVVVLAVAVFFDVREHRIPNWLTLPTWLVGLVVGVVFGGLDGLLEHGGGLLLLLLLTVPFFIFGWMGAGDVKLIAAVGSLVGSSVALDVLLGVVLAGLVMSLGMLLWKGELFQALKRYKDNLMLLVMMRRPTYIEPPESQKKLVLPYAVPIAVGSMAALMLHYTSY